MKQNSNQAATTDLYVNLGMGNLLRFSRTIITKLGIPACSPGYPLVPQWTRQEQLEQPCETPPAIWRTSSRRAIPRNAQRDCQSASPKTQQLRSSHIRIPRKRSDEVGIKMHMPRCRDTTRTEKDPGIRLKAWSNLGSYHITRIFHSSRDDSQQ